MHYSTDHNPCSFSQTWTDPFCSPFTFLLFTAYLSLILMALYVVLRNLHSCYRRRQYEDEMESAAYQRLLQRLVGLESNTDRLKIDGNTPHEADDRFDAGHKSRGNVNHAGEDMSGRGDDTVVRTCIDRASKHTRSEALSITETKYGTIAQRRGDGLRS